MPRNIITSCTEPLRTLMYELVKTLFCNYDYITNKRLALIFLSIVQCVHTGLQKFTTVSPISINAYGTYQHAKTQITIKKLLQHVWDVMFSW